MSAFYTVRQGDYLAKIARNHGFGDWRTIYDHPSNADFRRLRPNPNLIFPGDRLFIPSHEPATVSCETGAKHTFRLRQAHDNFLRIELRRPDNTPYGSTACTLVVGDESFAKVTDDRGVLEHPNLSTRVDRATLTIEGRTLTLMIGHLDPIETIAGKQGRLRNLSYYDGACHGRLDDATQAAILRFQTDHDLPPEDEPWPQLTDKLLVLYGF